MDVRSISHGDGSDSHGYNSDHHEKEQQQVVNIMTIQLEMRRCNNSNVMTKRRCT